MIHETETQTRLRKAKDALSAAIQQSTILRKQLADADDSVRVIREKVNELFLKNEKEETERKKKDYRHTTK